MLFRFKSGFFRLLIILISFLLFSEVEAAEVRVSFNEGFVGVETRDNLATDAKYLTSLGWSKFRFTQSSSTGIFVAQGNDIIGNVVITDANNVIHTIPGYIKWRAPSGTVTTIVFKPTGSRTLATSTGSYIIDATKYIGLTFIGRTLTIPTSGNGAYEVTGNAATSGLLQELNTYLETFQLNDPNGPVTVNAQTTSDQTPTITGTATLATGESLTVTVNGVEYSTSNGLVVNGTNWSLTIPSNLAFATYEVIATITDSDGYTLTDASTDELIIQQPPTLTVNATLKTFTTCSGCTIDPQSFTVSGSNLTQNIVVTAPTGVQVSTFSNTSFGSTVTLTPNSGTVTTTTVYTKLANNATTASSGTISVTTSGATSQTLTVTTNTDNSLNFDGTNDYVLIDNGQSSDLTFINKANFTLEAWIKRESNSNFGTILSKFKAGTSGNYFLGINSTGNLYFHRESNPYSLVSTEIIPLNSWNHVAAVYDGTNMKIFINGTEVGSVSASGNIDANAVTGLSNTEVLIGAKKNGLTNIFVDFFKGNIDEVRIWNIARNASDIQNSMFKELTKSESNLKAYYTFNQGLINGTNSINDPVINNSSISNIDGILNGFLMNGSTSNFGPGFIPSITSAGNATTVPSGNTLQLSNELKGGTWASSNSNLATIDATTGLVTGVANGTVSFTYTVCDKVVEYTLNVTQPSITVSGTLKTFTSCSGCNLPTQSFTVSGSNLGAPITISAPTGVEVSTLSSTSFAASITITPTAGSVANTSVFVRLINTASSISSGVISITSTGATTQSIAFSTNTDNALNFLSTEQYIPQSTSADYVQTNSTIFTNGQSDFTIEAWLNPSAGSFDGQYHGIIGVEGIAGTINTRSPSLYIYNGKIHFDSYRSTDGVRFSYETPSAELVQGQWSHVAVVKNGNTYFLYVNGIQKASFNAPATVRASYNYLLGAVDNFYVGSMDEVRFWSSSRTAQEINDNMFKELNGTETGLLSYFNFNQGNINGTNTSISTLNSLGSVNLTATLMRFALTGNTSNFVTGFIPSIKATNNATSVNVGSTLQLTNGLNGGTWSSSNTALATVNNSGLVTGVAVGSMSVTYTICEKTVSYNLTINPPAPAGLSYTSPNVYTTGTTIGTLTPTSTGGPITQYTIGPNLPAGLTINPTTGVISGTPSAVSSQTTYTVTGTNASGTVTATVVITVNASVGAPVVQTQTEYCVQQQLTEYKYAKVVFTNVKTFNAANSIQVAEWKWLNGNTEVPRTGVTVTNPNGSNPSGETPNYIYDGSNSTKWLDFNIKSGNNTSTLLFTFNGPGASITGYSWVTANDSEERDPKSWTVYMSNDNVNWTEVHTVSNYVAPSARFTATSAWSFASGLTPVRLSATAASGFTLRWYTTATGGTATTTAPTLNTSVPGTTTYYVSQMNQSNYETPRSVLTVNVNALPAAPVVSAVNYTVGATASNLTATALTGHSLQWYNSSTGGTATTTAFIPTTNTIGTQNYYVSQLNNSTGCEGARATIVVTIAAAPVAAPSSLLYTTPNVYTVGTAITSLNPTSTGGAITTYSISPSLPAGLTLNTSTGVISGNPSAVNAQTTYIVTGTNASGTVTATVVLTVNTNVTNQPQAALNAIDYGLLATDTVNLKLTTSNGVAPFTLILNNSLNNSKDTIDNLTPINNEVRFKLKRLDSTKVFTIFKLIDANNNTRTTGFTKDTTIVRLLKPQILLTLKADPAVKQSDNSFKTRLLLKVKNNGDLDLRNVQVNANLSTVFPAGINYILDSVRVLAGNFALNPNYTGAGTATSASSLDWTATATANSTRQSLATLDQNYLFNNGVSLNQGQEGEVAYYVSIGATTQNVTLKLQFESAGSGVLVKSDGTSSAQGTTSKSDDGTNINQHPDVTNQGLPLPTYVPLFPNEKIGASLAVSSAAPVAGGYQYHFTAKIKNYGNVNLDSLRIQYNLNELFPAPDQASLVGIPTVTRGNIVYNTNLYDGYNNVNLFDYGGDLQVGDSATYEYDLKVTTTRTAYTWPNYFVAYGRSINSGLFVKDTSMAGTNPDPNNDNDPIEQFNTKVTINFTPPAPPTVENKTYLFGSTKPANISGLVKSTPTGTIPVWCDTKTAACSVTAPSTPTEIGQYIFALRSYDTTTLLYSEVLVYDTIIIKPPVPIVVSKTYIIGASSNPNNIAGQVTGLTGSTLNYFKNAIVQTSVPTLGTLPGLTRYTTSQTVNGIQSDTVGFTVTMLDPKTMLHLQKIADEPKLQSNSTFNITYTFIVTNRTNEAMTNVLVVDNLQNTFPSPTAFDVVSISSTGGLVYNNAFNGKTDIQLLKATSSLAASAVDTIRLIVNLQPKGFVGTVNNIAMITATTPYGTLSINSSSTGFANETAKLPTPAVIPDLTIDIPEAFSPNRDGVNDRFVILKPFGTTLELEVYNRWGNIVYYNANYNNEWDGRGTNNFIGQDLMDGGYYYTLKAKSVNGNIQIFKGFVLIQR